jgi:hypothetical protein
MSKKIAKLQDKVQKLSNKETLTSWEKLNLVYAKLQLEDKSASKVYKNLFLNPSDELKAALVDAIGNFTPDFKTFSDKLPEKEFYSLWDGILACQKFNKAALLAAKAAAKVKKQGGEIE